jgi:Fe-S cluster biogenesis protein NfuA/nitrite reductase/ring-hydroxylating ferredoxin subunit
MANEPTEMADIAAIPSLESLLKPIESLEVIVQGWDESHRMTVQALRRAIDDLHKEALARLIRKIQAEPGGLEALKQVIADDVVYAVLRHLQLIRPSLNERIEGALDSVRPLILTHGGNVELVKIEPPDTVAIRLTGTCDGCPSSELTMTEGIEKAIRQHCPEIVTIKKVSGRVPNADLGRTPVVLVSPFGMSSDAGWRQVAELTEIPDGGIKVVDIGGQSLLLSRQNSRVTSFENACAHMGMPLEMGAVADGILTCPYHGFRYDLSSGECLTAPAVQLVPYLVRVVGMKVEVKART